MKTPGRRPLPKDPLFDLNYQESYYHSHIRHNPDTGCDEWYGPSHRQGYGMIGAWRQEDGVKIMTTTHRIAGRRKFGRALASDEFVIHRCSNPKCVTEDHLMLGDRFTVHDVMKQNARYHAHGRKPGSKNQPK
jgi:hypothetical protein